MAQQGRYNKAFRRITRILGEQGHREEDDPTYKQQDGQDSEYDRRNSPSPGRVVLLVHILLLVVLLTGSPDPALSALVTFQTVLPLPRC